MSMVMPRSFSSLRRSGSIPVSARTRLDLPWSMCPAVPATTWRTAAGLDERRQGGGQERYLVVHDGPAVQQQTVGGDAAELVRIGILPPDSQAALVRTWGRSYARLAEWQTGLLAGVVADGGDPADPAGGLADLAGDVLPRVEALQSYVWRRHLASAAEHLLDDANTLTATESQLSVCFVDIVGYTTRSRSLEGAELMAWVDRFEQDTTTLVVDHGGQVIKTIGDEVLFTVADPAAAVSIALTLAARTPGTVLHTITGDSLGSTLRLRTPAGVIETWSEEHDGTLLVGVDRTARTIATTIIHLPEVPGSAVAASLAGATR